MSKEDRELVLGKVGLLDKWNGFASRYHSFLKEPMTRDQEGLLSTTTLGDLNKASQFEGTRLVLLLDEPDFKKVPLIPLLSMGKVALEPVFQRAGLFQMWGFLPAQSQFLTPFQTALLTSHSRRPTNNG